MQVWLRKLITCFEDIKNIVKSGIFYPTFITVLSGNGKPLNIIQSCAELKRELIRVNMTVETDEDDLLARACDYQRDDVLAMVIIWDWLVNNLP